MDFIFQNNMNICEACLLLTRFYLIIPAFVIESSPMQDIISVLDLVEVGAQRIYFFGALVLHKVVLNSNCFYDESRKCTFLNKLCYYKQYPYNTKTVFKTYHINLLSWSSNGFLKGKLNILYFKQLHFQSFNFDLASWQANERTAHLMESSYI